MRSISPVYAGLLLAAAIGTAQAHEDHRGHGRPAHSHDSEGAEIARGVVFEDRNGNGTRERWERGVRDVRVSNGVDVVLTDNKGRYQIPLAPESVLFISKPADYDVPVNDQQLPQFYYLHYPEGTPPVAAFEFPVIAPTGPLPASIDFPLLPSRQERQFKALAFADTQTSSDQELDMLREDVVNDLIGNPLGAKFGMVAGDVVDDVLSLYERHNRMMAEIGVEMWNVPGNHDINFRSPNDRYSTETFKSVFGPTYYSFDYGNVHFVALDNVEYKGDGQGRFDNTVYRGFISEEQLAWLANDLKSVDKDKLLVIVTHIPLITFALDGQGQRFEQGDNINTVNLDQLLEVIRDFRHVYGIAGHDTSNSWKVQIDHRHGWYGYPFVAHTLAEVRGNDWSRGPRDERGVRAATMQDGNPNGYYLISFDGVDFKPRFIPASGNPNQAMRIVLDPLPEGVTDDQGEIVAINRGRLAPGTKVVVNLFDGGERDRVEMSLDGGPFVAMENVLRNDPFMERLAQRFAGTDDRFSGPQPSSHIWELVLPADLGPGLHTVRVRSEDEFGQNASAAFSFEVVAD